MTHPQRVSTCLWFDRQAEEAANFYVSLFPNSSVTAIARYGEGTPMPAGLAMTVEFKLDGTEFLLLNGGPHFKLTEAASLSVRCDTQAEVDRLWSALIANGGNESMCGWLKDRYGVSWQIVPTILAKYLNDPNRDRAARTMAAMMQVKKLDIAKLEAAYRGE